MSLCVDDRNEWPLDSMGLQCDVTKKNREDLSSPPREGAYVHGLYMEGARWDTQVHHSSIDFFLWMTVSLNDRFLSSSPRRRSNIVHFDLQASYRSPPLLTSADA